MDHNWDCNHWELQWCRLMTSWVRREKYKEGVHKNNGHHHEKKFVVLSAVLSADSTLPFIFSEELHKFPSSRQALWKVED